MTSGGDDERARELARLFEADRRADESAAPAFNELLARRPRRRRAAGAFSTLALAAAVAVFVAAAVLLLRAGALRPGAPSPAEGTLQLAEWKSPTAFLLDTPGSELLSEVPSLSAAPIAPAFGAALPQPTKGVSP